MKSNEEGISEIRRRISLLDDASPDLRAVSDVTFVSGIIDCLAEVTDGFMAGAHGGPGTSTSKHADELIDECRSVQHLRATMPSIASGPVDLEAQRWTVASPTRYSSNRVALLSEKNFKNLPRGSDLATAAKPLLGGLFSSTVIPKVNKTSWEMYIDSWGGSLFPGPFTSKDIRVANPVAVLEIRSAHDWVEMVTQNSPHHHSLLYPNWAAISENWDAVHFTIPALLAIQGIRFITPDGTIAESYWDVESTFWTKWAFVNAE